MAGRTGGSRSHLNLEVVGRRRPGPTSWSAVPCPVPGGRVLIRNAVKRSASKSDRCRLMGSCLSHDASGAP